MRKKPFVFDLLKVLFIGIIVAFPVQIMYLYEHYPWEVLSIASKISILNWMVIASCFYAAYLSHHADSKLLWFLPLMTLVVAWNNLIVGYVGFDYSATTTFLGTLAFAAVNGVFLLPSVQQALGQPSKRWWQNPSRFKVNVPVFVSPLRSGTGIYTDTFDLSLGGTFIPLKEQQAKNFEPGDTVSLSFTLGTFRTLRCNAQVVRNMEAKGIYPQGMGIKFMGLNRRQKDTLQQYFKSLNLTPLRQQLNA